MSEKMILVKQTQLKIDEELKKCKSVKDFVDMVFSFKFENHTIMPIQIKTEIEKLITILKDKKPKTLLEIGTANGGTLFLLCQAAAMNNAKIISVDLPDGPFGGDLYPKWKEPLYASFAKPSQTLHLIRSNSHEPKTLVKIKELLGEDKLDFLLIDGDHSYEGIKKDFEMYSNLISPGGIIAFHDVKPGPKNEVGGVPDYWKKVSKKYPSLEIIDDDGRSNSYGIGLLVLDLGKFPSNYIDVVKSLINIQKSEINKIHDQLHLTNLTVQEKDKKINQLNDQLHLTNLTVQEKDKKINQLSDQLHLTNLTVQEKDKKINQLSDQLQEKDTKINELNKISQNVKQMEIIISELEKIKITNESLITNQGNEIEAIKNSKTWKALQYYLNVKKTLTGKP